MKSEITIIFGYRDREIERVTRCLDSLNLQNFKNFSVIITDYGSDENYASKINELVKSYSFCSYIYVNVNGLVWNRSHALNIGLRLAKTTYVMFSDIDLIFTSNFMNEVINRLRPNLELHSGAFSLKKGFNDWDSLSGNPTNLKSRESTALGLCQIIEREKVMSIGGFDEYYRIWGVEDQDLSERLSKLGIKTEWLSLIKTPVYHQWHESSGLRTRTKIPIGWHKFMMNYKEKNRDVIKRNSDNWGEIILYNERPSMLYNKSSIEKIKLNNIPCFSVQGLIFAHLSKLKIGDGLIFQFDDLLIREINKSKLNIIIKKLNSLSNNYNFPVLLKTDVEYFGGYENVYSYYDQVMYFLIAFPNSYSDYYFTMTNKQLLLKLFK